MVLRLLLILIAAVLPGLSGCKKEEPAKPTPVAAPAQPKITEENLDAELDKMEAEIEADIAAD